MITRETWVGSSFLEESVRMKRDENANEEEQSLIKIAFEHRIAQLLTQITEKDTSIRQSKLELAQFKEMTLNCMDEQHQEWTALLEQNHSRQESLSKQCRSLPCMKINSCSDRTTGCWKSSSELFIAKGKN